MTEFIQNVELLEHNQKPYARLAEKLTNGNLIMLESCPGSGKSYVLMKYLQEHPGKALIVCPKKPIASEWDKSGQEYGISIKTMTYQKLCKLSHDELKALAGRYKYIIYDECHHLGAVKWKENPEWLKQNCTDIIYIGLTATPIRYTDGCKDVGKIFFNGNTVTGLSQKKAVDEGILPGFRYVRGLFGSPDFVKDLTKSAKGKSHGNKKAEETIRRFEYCAENRTEALDAFEKYMPDDERKGIVFVNRISNLDEAVDIMKEYSGDDENYFIAHSQQPSAKALEVIEDFEHVSHGWLFVVDMLNEGLHIPGVNTIVMFRKTISPSVYIQQLGRSQAVGGEPAVIFDFVGNSKGLKTMGFSTNTNTHHVLIEKEFRETYDPNVIIETRETEAAQLFKDLQDFVDGPWTEDEIRFLEDYYQRMGAQYCADNLGKTRDDCIEKAKSLGLKRQYDWNEDEERFLKENYSKLGYKRCADMLGIEESKCQYKAHEFGLKESNYWTDEERAILEKHYPDIGAGCADLLPGKTKEQCRSMAQRINIKYKNGGSWDGKQEEFLIKNYKILGAKECAEILGKSETCCWSKARRLGITKKHTSD